MVDDEDYLLMISIKMVCVFSLFLAVLLAALMPLASATTMNFTVNGGEETTKSLSLVVEDHMVIKFTVLGQTEDTLDFYIVDPDGNVTVEFSRQGDVRYSFVCQEAGDYVMHFSNAYSEENKLVTLDYEVQHYIFGIPQMLFLTMIIVVVCVAAVAVFVLMGKPR